MKKNFIKYVSLNVLGMMGISCFILADTYFVAQALGSNGLAALNVAIPVVSLVTGIGLMIGIGGGTRFTINEGLKDERRDIFTHSIVFAAVISLLLIMVGLTLSDQLVYLLGADEEIFDMTKMYVRVILFFASGFIFNGTLLAFVRNENNPRLSMVAMLVGSFSNIVLDYVFIFPLSMGIFGAAFATGISSLISIAILLVHICGKNSDLRFSMIAFEPRKFVDIMALGNAAFIAEASSAVILITFNIVIMNLAGVVGVAAYGIVANIALVVLAMFTGIAQGMQPLISQVYGQNDTEQLKQLKRYGLALGGILALCIYTSTFLFSDQIINLFNSENNVRLSNMAREGIRIYFVGFFFVSINLVMITILSACEQVRQSFILSLFRGIILVIPFVLILSQLFGMVGVWSSFVLTEGLVSLYFFISKKFF